MLDFLGIGAQKAGTTWLMRMLKQHPQVMISLIGKEVHYFDYVAGTISREHRMERAVVRLNVHLTRLQTKVRANTQKIAHIEKLLQREYMFSDGWYRDLFEPRPIGAIAGEITPNYASLPTESIQHIKRLMPNAAILFLIRDPYDRALSSLRMERAEDITPEEAIETRGFLSRGEYDNNVSRWDSIFGNRILYIPFGDIRSNPLEVMRKIEEHIGLPPLPNYEKLNSKVNSTETRDTLIGEDLRRRLRCIVDPQYAFIEQRFGSDFARRIK